MPPGPYMLMESTQDDGDICRGWYTDPTSACRGAIQLHVDMLRREFPYNNVADVNESAMKKAVHFWEVLEAWKPVLEAALDKTFGDVREANDWLIARHGWQCPLRDWHHQYYKILSPDHHEVRSLSADEMRSGLWADWDPTTKEKMCYCFHHSRYRDMKVKDEEDQAEHQRYLTERKSEIEEEAAATKKVRDELKWEKEGDERLTELAVQLREEILQSAIDEVWSKRWKVKRRAEATKLQESLRDEIFRRAEKREKEKYYDAYWNARLE